MRAARFVAGVNGAPERQEGERQDKAQQRARQVINAIRQVIPNPDTGDVVVFSRLRRRIRFQFLEVRADCLTQVNAGDV